MAKEAVRIFTEQSIKYIIYFIQTKGGNINGWITYQQTEV